MGWGSKGTDTFICTMKIVCLFSLCLFFPCELHYLLGLLYRILQIRWLKQQMFIFAQLWRLKVHDLGACKLGFWWRLFLTGRGPLSHFVLTWPFLCAWAPLVSLPLLIRTLILLDSLIPPLWPWMFFLQIQSHWGLGLQHVNLGRGYIIQCITGTHPQL